MAHPTQRQQDPVRQGIDPGRWYSTSEAGELLYPDRRRFARTVAVIRMCERGQLRATRLPSGKWAVSGAELLRFLDRKGR